MTTEVSGFSATRTGRPVFVAKPLVEVTQQRAAAGQHPDQPETGNLLDRQVTAEAPNQGWGDERPKSSAASALMSTWPRSFYVLTCSSWAWPLVP